MVSTTVWLVLWQHLYLGPEMACCDRRQRELATTIRGGAILAAAIMNYTTLYFLDERREQEDDPFRRSRRELITNEITALIRHGKRRHRQAARLANIIFALSTDFLRGPTLFLYYEPATLYSHPPRRDLPRVWKPLRFEPLQRLGQCRDSLRIRLALDFCHYRCGLLNTTFITPGAYPHFDPPQLRWLPTDLVRHSDMLINAPATPNGEGGLSFVHTWPTTQTRLLRGWPEGRPTEPLFWCAPAALLRKRRRVAHSHHFPSHTEDSGSVILL